MALRQNSNIQNKNGDNGFLDSIAALRSVLMLNNPIEQALVGGGSSKNQNEESQKQLCSSPASMTQAMTPGSLKTPTPSKLSRSPEALESATIVLEKKIKLLEASRLELEERLKGEIDQKETLQKAHDKISSLQAKQSCQLEQIMASRDSFREESVSLEETLDTERKKHSKTIAFLKNTASNEMQSRISMEKERFQIQKEMLEDQLQRSENRCTKSELLVKSLTKEVDKINTNLTECRESNELALKETSERHAKRIAALQVKLEQTESGLLEQINKERKFAEANYEQLQEMKKHCSKLKNDQMLEKEKMISETTTLQASLKEATNARNLLEQKLEESTVEIARYQSARNESEKKIQQLITELNAVKGQLTISGESMSKIDEQEHPIHNDDENLSKAPDTERGPVERSNGLQSEIQELQHQLKDVKDNRNQLKNELLETRMELDGLKENLEEAERIELQNEEVVAQLETMSTEMERKDQLIQNMKLELEKAVSTSVNRSGAESTDDANGNNEVDTIHDLREEIKKLRAELADSKEKLDISTISNLNRLVEVATNREKVRNLETELEEIGERIHGEGSEGYEISDRKYENEEEGSPKKRLKTMNENQFSCDDDDIVL